MDFLMQLAFSSRLHNVLDLTKLSHIQWKHSTLFIAYRKSFYLSLFYLMNVNMENSNSPFEKTSPSPSL
jgi:hypothetical protein